MSIKTGVGKMLLTIVNSIHDIEDTKNSKGDKCPIDSFLSVKH